MIVRKKIKYENKYKEGEWYPKFCLWPRSVYSGDYVVTVWLGYIERSFRWDYHDNTGWKEIARRLPDG